MELTKESLESLLLLLKHGMGGTVDKADGTVAHLVHESFKVMDNLSPKPKRHAAELGSLKSLPTWIATAARWQEGAEGWLFWTDGGITFFPDINQYPKMAPATFNFQLTKEAKDWGAPGFSGDISQKAFRKLIETAIALPDEIIKLHDAPKWLDVVSKMTMVKQVSAESVIENNQNFKVAFQSSTGAGTVEVPKDLLVELELFEGAPKLTPISFRVDFSWDDGRAPKFELVSFTAARLVRQMAQEAVEWVAAEVAREMPEYSLIVVNGTKG